MNIQKEKVRKELVSLCLGEFTDVLSFWFCFFLLKNRLGDWNSLATILYPLSLLTFILLQGSIYWAILIRRLSKFQSLEALVFQNYMVVSEYYFLFYLFQAFLLLSGIHRVSKWLL